MNSLVVYIVVLIYPDKSKYICGVFKSFVSASNFVSVCCSKDINNCDCKYMIYDFPVLD